MFLSIFSSNSAHFSETHLVCDGRKNTPSYRNAGTQLTIPRTYCIAQQMNGQCDRMIDILGDILLIILYESQGMKSSIFLCQHCGPDQSRALTAVLAHSLVHLLIRSHRSLVHFAHSLARKTVND